MASSVVLRPAGRPGAFIASNGSWSFEFDLNNEAGPRSIDLLLFSLGTCTIGTLTRYMEHKGLDPNTLEVTLSSDYEAANKQYGTISVNLRLTGDLTESQLRSIRAVASTCRIHNTLKNFPGVELDAERSPPSLD